MSKTVSTLTESLLTILTLRHVGNIKMTTINSENDFHFSKGKLFLEAEDYKKNPLIEEKYNALTNINT